MPQFSVYPHSSYEPRQQEPKFFAYQKPTLYEVITDTAPHPWTLVAFRDFLSEKFCLEILEFTLDASAYRRAYESIDVCKRYAISNDNDIQHLRQLWQRLLDTYIMPNAPFEINISSTARDRLIALYDADTPPPPEVLNCVLAMMHELMGGALFLEFLQTREHLESQSLPYEHRKRPSFFIEVRSKSVENFRYKRANGAISLGFPHGSTIQEDRHLECPDDCCPEERNSMVRVFRNIRWHQRKSS